MKYLILFFLILVFCSSCGTAKVYNKSFTHTTTSIVALVNNKEDFFHRSGAIRHDPTIIIDSTNANKWKFYVKPVNEYWIYVKKKNWQKTRVRIKGKASSLLSAPDEDGLIKKIDEYVEGH